MREVEHGQITTVAGLVGDHKGAKFKNRAITILAREDWQDALAELSDLAGPVPLPWTVRRANLLVEGLGLPRKAGTRLRIGATCVIEITCECDPCARMDAIAEGLRKALEPDWRGGFLGQVITDGEIATGDTIRIEE